MHPARLSFVPLILAAVALAGCASRSERAPVADISKPAAEPASKAPSTAGSYVVKPGDTLYKIAQANNIQVARLSELNHITDPSQLRVGQVLKLDGAASASSPSADTDTSRSSEATTKPGDSDIKPIEPVEPIGTTVAARASDAEAIDWGWPGSGKVIQGFNSTTKGIDLEGNIGDPVNAAAGGDVMYAGNGVRGLGNLVLIGHSDGFITAYAHNDELLVKAGQTVKKGEKIATVGETDTSSPRLHFEVRRRGTPVDPLSYLPAR